MPFTLTEDAARWLKRELKVDSGDYVRFYVRYGGMNGPGNGFSLGVHVTPPSQIGEKTVVDGVTFYVEQDDMWFFHDQALTVQHNKETDDIEFVYSR